MPDYPPPLKVLSTGAAQAIPVYELEFVTGTLTKTSPIRARYTPPAGGGSSVVYAATGNQYVTLADASDLTADRVLTASTGIQIKDVGANSAVLLYIDSFVVTTTRAINTTYPLAGGGNLSTDRTHTVDTAFLVTSARQVLTVYPLSGGGNLSADQTFSVTTGGFLVVSSRAISTTAPLAGGGNLAVDRTFTLDTAAVVTSGRSISTLYPLTGGGDLSANRTFSADTAFLVTSTRVISFGSALFAGGGNLGADRTITIGTPIGVGSGGIGSLTLTAQGVLYGSGASAIQATSALNAGMLAVGSGLGMNLAVIGSGSTGQMLISTGGAIVGNIVWINTIGQIKIVELTFLSIVPVAGGGTVWSNMPAAETEFYGKTTNRNQFDISYVSSVRLVDVVSLAGTAGSFLALQASTDAGANWKFLGGASSPAVRADSAGGFIGTSPWVAITSGYIRDVWLRIVGSGGDGVVDPEITQVKAQFY